MPEFKGSLLGHVKQQFGTGPDKEKSKKQKGPPRKVKGRQAVAIPIRRGFTIGKETSR